LRVCCSAASRPAVIRPKWKLPWDGGIYQVLADGPYVLLTRALRLQVARRDRESQRLAAPDRLVKPDKPGQEVGIMLPSLRRVLIDIPPWLKRRSI
jgi:hypothetical protein